MPKMQIFLKNNVFWFPSLLNKTGRLSGFLLKKYGFGVIIRINKGGSITEKLGSLYKKSINSDDYICSVTGNKCRTVTEHMASFRRFVKEVAGKNQTFITQSENLCETTNCPIWNNTMRKIEAYVKQTVK